MLKREDSDDLMILAGKTAESANLEKRRERVGDKEDEVKATEVCGLGEGLRKERRETR